MIAERIQGQLKRTPVIASIVAVELALVLYFVFFQLDRSEGQVLYQRF